MADIAMPSLGADMDAGTLVEWLVGIGDRVERGAVVALIETEKATMELESFVAGEVEAILVAPGTKVPVGTVLARLRADDTATPPSPQSPQPSRPPPPPGPTPSPSPRPPRSSPAARRRARELGIDLAAITGTGPSGAIVLHDVVAPLPPPPSPPPSPPQRSRPSTAATPIRGAIAAAMSRSKREIPHYYLAHTISVRRALRWLADNNASRPIQDRVLPGALLLRAVAVALWDVPELNGFWIDGAYRGVEAVHLGTAIALRTGGVIAPAILDADQKSLDQIMSELRDLVARARAGRLRGSELTAATITVTSLGDRGCEAVWPIIAPPQVAIIGFGAIIERPWVDTGQVAVHPTVVATLAADHRVTDGHRGGLFLNALDRVLQSPEHL
jgi:pyruvate dehydrogenase E2 component (dihydrolipoamide acetyltransferase)